MSPTIILVVRFLHIVSAIAMTGGIFARQIVRRQAGRVADLGKFAALNDAARRIETFLVVPGSSATLAIGVVLALMTGAPILGFLQGEERNWLLASNLLILAVILVIPLVFLPQRKRLEKELVVAAATGHVTPALRAVVDERAPMLWHYFEEVAVVLVVLLMVTKPF